MLTQNKEISFFNEQFLIKNALILIDHGDYKLALNLLKSVLDIDSKNKEALQWSGYCLFQIGQKEKALSNFIKLADIDPSEKNYFQVGESLYDCGQYELAKVFLNKSLEMIDYESAFLFPINKMLGNIFVQTKDFDQAEEFYNKAYILNPHSDELFVNYGVLEIQRENYDIAQDRFKQALDLNLNNSKAWVGLSLVNRTKHDKSLAWANLYRALDVDPTLPTALKLAVDWSIEDFEFEKAIQRLERSFKYLEPSAEWLAIYSSLLFHAGDWKKSLEIANEILGKDSNNKLAKEIKEKIETNYSV